MNPTPGLSLSPPTDIPDTLQRPPHIPQVNTSQERVAQLATAITEDYNDMLTIIQTQAEEAARNPHAASATAMVFEQVFEASRSLSNRVRSLLASPASEPPAKTTVQIPTVESLATTKVALPPSILIVDDDENICQITAQVLKAHGYRVFTANNAIQGLKIWDKERGSLSLLITDINMPGGVNGVMLGKTVQTEAPTFPVIYTSGNRALHEFDGLDGGKNYMPKPFGMHDLLKIVELNLPK